MALRPLVRLDRASVVAHVNSGLEKAPGLAICGAFLFGSSLGECRPESDIDLGLVPAPGFAGPDWGLEAEVEAVLRPFEGHPPDASVLRPSPFGFEAVTAGQLIHVRDEAAVWDFVLGVCRRGAEMHWRYLQALRLATLDLGGATAHE